MGYSDANSTEIDSNTKYPVIDILPGQNNVDDLGGTMRLGSYSCKLSNMSKAREIYGQDIINERHRHRYEFNDKFRNDFLEKGLIIAGTSVDEKLVEIIEIKDHPWFVACQFHPEFKSRPNKPHPLFKGFIREAYNLEKERK